MTTMRVRRLVLHGIGILVAGFVIASGARASEESVALTFDGLEAFNSHRYEEAWGCFDRAVRSDGDDVTALYYRGITAARLAATTESRLDEAIADLRSVRARRPTWPEVALELGIALTEAMEYRAALTELQVARGDPTLAARADFFSGLAYRRLNEGELAREHLGRATLDPQLHAAAEYHLAIIAYEDHDWVTAARLFESVLATIPETEIGREARKFLALIRAKDGKAYHAYGSVAFAYDSNVALVPSDESDRDALGVTNDADGRTTIALGGFYSPWSREAFQLTLGYEFSQQWYFDNSRFDLQDHRPTIQLTFRHDPIQYGIMGRYDYYRLANDDFLQEASALPWIRVLEGRAGYTELAYRFRYSDYLDDEFAPRLDALRHSIGIRQSVPLGSDNRLVWLGYRFEHSDARHHSGDVFAFDAHEVEAGVSLAIPVVAVGVNLGYRFRHEDYDDHASHGRNDDEHGVAVSLARPITDHVRATLGYLGTFNDSNQGIFAYDRHIVSLAAEVSY